MASNRLTLTVDKRSLYGCTLLYSSQVQSGEVVTIAASVQDLETIVQYRRRLWEHLFKWRVLNVTYDRLKQTSTLVAHLLLCVILANCTNDRYYVTILRPSVCPRAKVVIVGINWYHLFIARLTNASHSSFRKPLATTRKWPTGIECARQVKSWPQMLFSSNR